MMIWNARAGGGAVFCDVSVLCGAGGGLTVQADTIASAPARATAGKHR